MKKTCLLLAALAFACSGIAHAKGGSHSVRGYTKKDGTYVPPSRATNPDHSKSNNWSQKGNTNPYTGKEGTKQ